MFESLFQKEDKDKELLNSIFNKYSLPNPTTIKPVNTKFDSSVTPFGTQQKVSVTQPNFLQQNLSASNPAPRFKVESKGKDIADKLNEGWQILKKGTIGGLELFGKQVLPKLKEARQFQQENQNPYLDPNSTLGKLQQTPEDYKKFETKVDKITNQLDINTKKANETFNNYFKSHPNVKTPEYRKEWNEGWLKNPSVLLDPGYILYEAAGSAAYTLAALTTTGVTTLTTGNPLLGIGVSTAALTPSVTKDLYDELIANGASEEEALAWSTKLGPILAAAESVGDLPIIQNLYSPFKKKIRSEVAKLTIGYIAKKGIKDLAKAEISEIGTELLQQGITNAAVQTFNDERNLFDNFGDVAARTAVSTLVFSTFGTTANISERIANATPEEKKQLNDGLSQIIQNIPAGLSTKDVSGRSLEEKYPSGKEAPQLNKDLTFYRETSAVGFDELFNGRDKYTGKFFDTNLDLALGQGENQGIIVKVKEGSKTGIADSKSGGSEKLISNIEKSDIESVIVPEKLIQDQKFRISLKNKGFDVANKQEVNAGITRQGTFYEIKNNNFINNNETQLQETQAPKQITLIHYSPQDNLQSVDPEFMGTGSAGREMKNQTYKDKDGKLQTYPEYLKTSDFYVEGGDARIEAKLFGNQNVYKTTIDANKLWDINEQGKKPTDPELQKQGYEGYMKDGQVRLFNATPVEKIGKSSVKMDNINNVTGKNYAEFIKQEPKVVTFEIPVEGTQLNIGLDIGDIKDALTFDTIQRVLKDDFGVDILQSLYFPSETENSYNVVISKKLTSDELYNFSDHKDIRQGAIPQASGNEGILAGPQAAEWGTFDPGQFTTIDGRLLSEVQEDVTPEKVNLNLNRLINDPRFQELSPETKQTITKEITDEAEQIKAEVVSMKKIEELSKVPGKEKDMFLELINAGEGKLAAATRAAQDELIQKIANTLTSVEDRLSATQKLLQINAESGRVVKQNDINYEERAQITKDALDKLEKEIIEKGDPEQIKQIKAGKSKLIKLLKKPNLWDAIVEGSTAIKLTSPVTYLKNFIGNATSAIVRPLEKTFEGGIDAITHPNDRTKFVGEAIADIYGRATSIVDSAKAFYVTILDEDLMINDLQNQGIQEKGKAIPGLAGRIIRTPYKILAATDMAGRVMNMSAELNSLAYKKAKIDGKKGADLWNSLKDIMLTADDKMMAEAKEKSTESLYQKELSPGMNDLKNAINKLPPMRLIVAFFKTPVDLFNFSYERSVLGITSPRNLREIFGKDPAKRTEAFARVIIGQITGWSLFYLAYLGYITGAAPDNKGEREKWAREGIKPYSLKIGDKYVSYRGTEPFGFQFSLAASMVEAVLENPDADVSEKITKLVSSIGNNLIDQPYLVGIKNVLDGLTDAERDGWALENLLTGTVVPTGSGYIAKVIDPTFREATNLKEKFMIKIPGLKQQLPPKYDALGDIIREESSMLQRGLGINLSTYDVSQADAELDRLGINISTEDKKIDGMKLTSEELSDLNKTLGEYRKKIVLYALNDSTYLSKNIDDQKKDLLKALTSTEFNVKRKKAQMILELRSLDLDLDSKEKSKIWPDMYESMGSVKWRDMEKDQKKSFIEFLLSK